MEFYLQLGTFCPNNLGDYIRQSLTRQIILKDEPWVVSKGNKDLKTYIASKGIPLHDWNISINYGIKTGLNDAFIIDTPTKERLCEEDPKSAEIIRPILRGKDIKAWIPEWAGLWLINSHNGITKNGTSRVDVVNQYPAIYNHLKRFEEALVKRVDKGNHWSNLRDCSFLNDFDKPKIIYPNMTKYLPFVYDNGAFFCNQKCFIITGEYLEFLTCFFNSDLFKYAYKDWFPPLGDDRRELSKIFFIKIPVVRPTNEQQNEAKVLLSMLTRSDLSNKQRMEWVKKNNIFIYGVYNLSPEQIAEISYASDSQSDT